ncbi:MAG: phosphate ABC transporter substrate-binding protein PstS [Candidatus Korobacteraceae bacterium]
MPSRATTAFLVLLLTVTAPVMRLEAQTAQSLAQVKKLYVEAFDGGKPALQLRQALIKRLRKSKYQIVENASEADAILKGTGQIWVKGYLTTNWRSPSTNRQAVYGGYLSAEVVGKDRETLWSYLVTPGKLIWSGIIDDLAGNMAKEMIAASSEQSSPSAVHKDSLAQTNLSGAGATFPAPLYRKWLQSFQQQYPEVHITYNPIGSEKGVHQLAEHELDFAGSDVSSPDLGDPHMHRNFRRFASVLGAVVPIYNVSDLSEDLRFTPDILAGIYLGKIRKWNDPEIRKVNKGADLPDAEIVVVHRADGSGTTYAWSDFLAKVSPEWKSAVGAGTHLAWPVGIGAEGNEGVAEKVQQTPNSIGYVELVYAIQHQLNYGLVRNSAGEYIRAGLDTLSEAARTSAASDSTGMPASITNAPGKGAYPIATFTWLVLPDEIADNAKKAALIELLKWVLSDGQKQCSALGYAPLPREVAERELELVNAIQ